MGVAFFYRRIEVLETCSCKTYRKLPKRNSIPDVFYNIHFSELISCTRCMNSILLETVFEIHAYQGSLFKLPRTSSMHAL